MVYNELGKTGMKVSNLGFGASSLGGVFHNIREEEGIQAVHTAVENGINFIDVSPYYGHLKAEIVLGKALKDIPREKYYLSTKVGRYGKDGVNTWDYSAKRGIAEGGGRDTACTRRIKKERYSEACWYY